MSHAPHVVDREVFIVELAKLQQLKLGLAERHVVAVAAVGELAEVRVAVRGVEIERRSAARAARLVPVPPGPGLTRLRYDALALDVERSSLNESTG